MNIKKHFIVALSLVAVVLSGCAVQEKKSGSDLAKNEATLKLESGKSYFHAGNYSQAESDLLNTIIWQASPKTRVESLKYLAFIYCVTDRVTLCRHSFYKALQLDPTFKLSPAESTHPLWGPEFIVALSGQNGI